MCNREFIKTEFKTIALRKTLTEGIPVGQGACKAVRIILNQMVRNSIVAVDPIDNAEPFFIYYGDAQSQEVELKAQGYAGTNAASFPNNVSPMIFCQNQEEVFIRYAGKEVPATPGTREVLHNTVTAPANITHDGVIRAHFDGNNDLLPPEFAGTFPHNVDFNVLNGDTPAQVHDKAIIAINADVTLDGVLTANAGGGAVLSVTMDTAQANDTTFVCNLSIPAGSVATGLTPTNSTIFTAGVAPTAEEVGASQNWPEIAYVQVVIYL